MGVGAVRRCLPVVGPFAIITLFTIHDSVACLGTRAHTRTLEHVRAPWTRSGQTKLAVNGCTQVGIPTQVPGYPVPGYHVPPAVGGTSLGFEGWNLQWAHDTRVSTYTQTVAWLRGTGGRVAWCQSWVNPGIIAKINCKTPGGFSSRSRLRLPRVHA